MPPKPGCLFLYWDKQAEEDEQMKKISEIIKSKLVFFVAFVMSLVGMASSASAEALGEGYSLMGINLGWALVLLGVAFFILVGLNVVKKSTGKKWGTLFVAFLLVGLALVFVEVPAETQTADISDSNCCGIDYSASAIASGGDYITTTTWDEDSSTLTIPLTVSDSSDGNLTGDQAGINITIDPIASGMTTDDICMFTVSSDYTMQYGGEDVLDKSGSNYLAEITTSAGSEYYEDVVKLTADDTAWVNVSWTFVNGTSGSWVSELSQVGDSLTWYVNIENSCGESERITVTAMVVSYTA